MIPSIGSVSIPNWPIDGWIFPHTPNMPVYKWVEPTFHLGGTA